MRVGEVRMEKILGMIGDWLGENWGWIALRPLLPARASLALALADSLRMGAVTQIGDLDSSA